MNNITETMEGLDLGLKDLSQADILESLFTDDHELRNDNRQRFRTFIIKCFADLIGVSYKDFKLIAISAWEHDETHIRHLSCNEFSGLALEYDRYVLGTPTMKVGFPWKPGFKLSSINSRSRQSGIARSRTWGPDQTDEVLKFIAMSIVTYFFGPPRNPRTRSKKELDRVENRERVEKAMGLDNCIGYFLYELMEACGETGFSNEGAVVEITFDGEDGLHSEYYGQAYVPEPELVIESAAHHHLSENIYL